MRFNQLGFSKEVVRCCQQLRFAAATDVQAAAAPRALRGESLVVRASTGQGKTVLFTLVALQRYLAEPRPYFALVLASSTILAQQIYEFFEVVGSRFGVKAALVCGKKSLLAQQAALGAFPAFVVATPGRLRVAFADATLAQRFARLRLCVLDECGFLLGDSIRPDLDAILALVPPEAQLLCFDAARERVAAVDALFGARAFDTIECFAAAPPIAHFVLDVGRRGVLLHVLRYLLASDCAQFGGATQGLVVARTIKQAIVFASALRKLGFAAASLHALQSAAVATRVLDDFAKGRFRLLVSTAVLSRGIDLPCVDWVVNLAPPQTAAEYLHAAGRCGRAGVAGACLTLLCGSGSAQRFAVLERDAGVAFEPYALDVLRALADSRAVSKALAAALFELEKSPEGARVLAKQRQRRERRAFA